MKLIRPTIISNAHLTSSNVAENDHDAWDISTDYATDAFVIVIGTTHKIYKAVQASGPATSPVNPTVDNGTYWTPQSATNRWKAFDQKISAKVENASAIEYIFDNLGLIDGFALFGLEAESAQLIITNGTEVYNQTIDLIDTDAIVDGYSYFFEPISYKPTVIFAEVPPYSFATYQVIISASGTAKVGQIVLGRNYVIGNSLFGTSIGLIDYSVRQDDGFGNWNIIQRAYSETVDFDVIMDTGSAQRTRQLMSSIRATPVVFFADETLSAYGTVAYGFFKDFSVVLSGPVKSKFSLEVEGLT